MGLFTNPLGHAGYPPGVTGTPSTQPTAVRAATAAESAAGVLSSVYISPATLDSATALDFASPPVAGFGSNTARPVAATTLTVTAPSVSGASPIVNNSRAGQAVFTTSIASGGYATLTLTNSSITATSRILYSGSSPTVNTAPYIAGITPGAGTVAFRVYNGGAAETTSFTINYWVMN